MKKILILSPVIVLLCFSFITIEKKSSNRLDLIKASLLKDASQLAQKGEELHKKIEQNKSKEDIIFQLIQLRKQYKSLECYLGYFDPKLEKKINGPNIPIIASDGLNLNIYDPTGMQIIEELLAENTIDYKQLLVLSTKLNIDLKKLKRLIEINTFDNRQILEMCRDNVLRIESLGLNAFDNPILDQTFAETLISWCTTEKYINYYYSISSDNDLKSEIQSLFEEGKKVLSNAEFDNFNRFHFIKEIADPLHKKLYQFHLSTSIETFDEVYQFERPVNYEASGIFNQELLNPNYFARGHQYEENTELILLGKYLFFDPILSGNNERSCASCHNPEKAFTDGMDKSIAFDFEGKVERNSPTIINAVYQSHFFWDMRAEALDQQFKHVIASSKEFNTNYTEMCAKLIQSEEYRELFLEAFNDKRITPNRVSQALEAFVRSIKSFNSPFDKMIRGEMKTKSQVERGFNLFMGKANCSTCHFVPTFSGNVPPYYSEMESEVLGVTKTPNFKELDDDLGRFKIYVRDNKNDALKHAFKTPSIRNIELTAPYMHNGSFETMEQVIDFYNFGGGQGMGLPLSNQTLPPDSLHLNKSEIQDLIVFMKALTDTSCVQYAPKRLPKFNEANLDNRIIGGKY